MEHKVEQGNEDAVTFDTALRGYDRRQVEDRLSFLRAELTAAEEGLRASQHRTSALESDLEQVRTELQQAHAQLAQRSDTDMENSFGFRVERILRLAEAEAKQVRGRAENEAKELLKQAAADVEERRQQVEQELATRIEAAERDVTQREAAVAQRERQVEADAATVRRESAELRETARREVEALRKDAWAEVEELRTEAHAEADRVLAGARAEAEKLISDADAAVTEREHAGEQELDRLHSLQDEVEGRLDATWKLLAAHFAGRKTAASGQQPNSVEPAEHPDGIDPPSRGGEDDAVPRDENGHFIKPAAAAPAN